MRGLVWGSTYEIGKRMLESVKEEYLFSGYKIVEEVNSKNSRTNYIIFNNGDVWKVVSPTDSARGNKANLSYVDNNITDVDALSMIRACTIARPWNAIKFVHGV